jgi:hypothetical protein
LTSTTHGWEVAPRTAVAEPAWDDVVDASDDGWLWHRHRFQDVLTTWGSRQDHSFALLDGDAIACVVPAHGVTNRARGIRLATLDSFGGPCFAVDLDEADRTRLRSAVQEVLRDLARRSGSPYVTASLPPLAPSAARSELNPLLAMGFEDRSDQSWIVSLEDDLDVVWGRVQSRTRRYIKSAGRDGATVRSATIDDLDAYYALHLETAARTGITAHPRAYFEAIWRDLVPAGLAGGYVVEHDDRIVAACNVARYKGGVVYWTAASNEGGRAVHANDLLLWEVIRRSAEDGFTAVELGDVHTTATSTGKHLTISRFKSKFAGGTRPLHRGRMMVAGPLGRLRMQAIDAAIAWRIKRSRA